MIAWACVQEGSGTWETNPCASLCPASGSYCGRPIKQYGNPTVNIYCRRGLTAAWFWQNSRVSFRLLKKDSWGFPCTTSRTRELHGVSSADRAAVPAAQEKEQGGLHQTGTSAWAAAHGTAAPVAPQINDTITIYMPTGDQDTNCRVGSV